MVDSYSLLSSSHAVKPHHPQSSPFLALNKKAPPLLVGEMELQQSQLIRRSGKANRCAGKVRLWVEYVKE